MLLKLPCLLVSFQEYLGCNFHPDCSILSCASGCSTMFANQLLICVALKSSAHQLSCFVTQLCFWRWFQLHESWPQSITVYSFQELLRRRQQGLYASTRRLSQEWRFHDQTHWSLGSEETHRWLATSPKVGFLLHLCHTSGTSHWKKALNLGKWGENIPQYGVSVM